MLRTGLSNGRPTRAFTAISRPLSSSSTSDAAPPNSVISHSSNQYYKITLLRSAISLGSKKKGTLVSLGIHRRLQTVYHPHSPEFAGKILAVKELVKVENVSEEEVKSKTEQRQERKASRGFEVVSSLRDRSSFGAGVPL
ncbi:hypothetical protein DFH11DRAFT_1699416 [Phellopilus nigrolimitatus]|nr:hypothetical protein DFH11DRAFT_1699416 [Phellopilus nigrolimitatus]